jgi:hypothetical protein
VIPAIGVVVNRIEGVVNRIEDFFDNLGQEIADGICEILPDIIC